jgi:uncharacterized Tic20 family protein
LGNTIDATETKVITVIVCFIIVLFTIILSITLPFIKLLVSIRACYREGKLYQTGVRIFTL